MKADYDQRTRYLIVYLMSISYRCIDTQRGIAMRTVHLHCFKVKNTVSTITGIEKANFK